MLLSKAAYKQGIQQSDSSYEGAVVERVLRICTEALVKIWMNNQQKKKHIYVLFNIVFMFTVMLFKEMFAKNPLSLPSLNPLQFL